MQLGILGITPQKQKQFHTKGIYTAEDLVRYLPRRYNDFTKETGILPETETSCFVMMAKKVVYGGNGKTSVITVLGKVRNTGENVRVSWFNQKYIGERLERSVGRWIFVAGKASYNAQYDNYSLNAPLIYEPLKDGVMRVYPVYSKIAGMSAEYLETKLNTALLMPEAVAESLPEWVVSEEALLPMSKALYQIHCPKTMEEVDGARHRLAFDDLLSFATANEWAQRGSAVGSPFNIKTLQLEAALEKTLPYTLTVDQSAAVKGMISDAKSGKRLNALVQGDVGCGKTAIAFLMMAAFAGSGYQTALMAPTQVLAKQHYEKLSALLAPHGYTPVYLGSELKQSEQKKVRSLIESGEARFVVGTHSVIGDAVHYRDLALVVTDEEHKFGVAQRDSLIKKAGAGVHSITMSATPIPRTLAHVLYGNALQLYTITAMPQGRKPVITGIGKTREKTFSFLLREIKQGRQAFVVCPMIAKAEDASAENVRSVEETAAIYRKAFAPHGVRIATLTGKDSKQTANDTLRSFRAGEVDILIATTVVEVGVDVPNATVIVIESADRFGLSQLHQLRGRVGRGAEQAYCVLLSDNLTEKAKERLDVLCSTTSGFDIAEADLKLRGAGDFLGTKQTGDNQYISLVLASMTLLTASEGDGYDV